MASSSYRDIVTCILDPEYSNPSVYAKDKRPYKFSDLTFGIENPVDIEGLRVNGYAHIINKFDRQGLLYYFDILNGPTYVDLVKEFWMKASIVTKGVYNKRVKDLIEKRPELDGKSAEEMGIRPFYSTEIESFVVGVRVSIRLSHICEALNLTEGGVYINNSDEVGPEVDDHIFKPRSDPNGKIEMTNDCKVIYKILIDSIMSKLGGTDHVSSLQKLFTYHVDKGHVLNIARIIFVHLAESITSTKSIIRHGRLLSHMFAQSGLLDAVKQFLPGYGNFLLSSRIINSVSLRYLKLIKNSDIVTPTIQLFLRESEANIRQSQLVRVNDSEARKVVEIHVKLLESLGAKVNTDEDQEAVDRQKRLQEPPSKVVPVKRKAVRSPGKAVSKKVKTQAAPKTKSQGSGKAPRKLLVKKIRFADATEEEKEQADMDEAIRLVEERKKKDILLKDSYDSGMDPKDFDEMYQKIPPVAKLDSSLHVYGNADGKIPNLLDNTQRSYDVFRKAHFNPMIRVKRVFDKIFKGVNSLEESDLSENQPISNPLASIIEPIIFSFRILHS
jgi:hypothetical protein